MSAGLWCHLVVVGSNEHQYWFTNYSCLTICSVTKSCYPALVMSSDFQAHVWEAQVRCSWSLPRSKHLCCNVFNTGRAAAVNNGVNVCTLTASLYTDCHCVNSLFTQRVILSWQLASLLNVTLTEVTVLNASTEDVHLPKCQQVSTKVI